MIELNTVDTKTGDSRDPGARHRRAAAEFRVSR